MPTLRLDGYVRVSDVRGRGGPSFLSPTLQRDRIEAWCTLFGARLVRVVEEMDQSGARPDRPELLGAIERVESGRSDGIVVARLDRFGRSLTDALAHLDRIQRAGGTFVSVGDQFDLSTDHGRLMLRMMLSFAEYERDRIRSSWDDVRRKRVERGIHGASNPPTGYRKGPDARLVVSHRQAMAIGEAFEMAAQGGNLGAIGRLLRQRGIRGNDGSGTWSPSSVAHLLENRAYLGEARNGPYVKRDAHPALVDPVTWRLAQRRPRRIAPHRAGLLSGLARCATCRAVMTITGGSRAGEDRSYRCSRPAAAPCPAPAAISSQRLDTLAEDLLFSVARRRPQVQRRARSAIHHAELALAQAEDRLARYRDSDATLGVLTDEQYAAGLETRSERVRRLAEELMDRRAAYAASIEGLLEQLPDGWQAMDVPSRRRLLHACFDVLFVAPGRDVRIEDRVFVCETGEGPGGLPAPGCNAVMGTPFVFPRSGRRATRQLNRMLAASRYAWSKEEIERRLREFIGDGDTFPTPKEFVEADQRRLYEHVKMRGGGPLWASRLRVTYPQQGRTTALLWTRDRVEQELEPFLAGRSAWPRYTEFCRAGKQNLRRALVRFAPIEEWAAQFDLSISNMRGPHLVWTDDQIEAACQELIGESGEWPRRADFRRAGLDGCYGAIWRGLGARGWATRLGVRFPDERGGRKPAASPPD
ncbi:recombinase family protein [Conexibacter sp. SYSU D00693]|uniref:recombinase family protein n=1 Tax=Conexibacter sp. SYSU D00693 TaxID=2812560 RepID=UPI001F11D491|nr:recombinase family protein [Conexibacter sp. SYSU D00693]